jgi:hypothetical protein
MPQPNAFPSCVTVRVTPPCPAGLAVRLRFGMNAKNSYSYLAFLNSQGIAQVSSDELLRTFAEERSIAIMDYVDPRIGFTGKIGAKIFDTNEILGAIHAYEMFKSVLSYPDNYEAQLKIALKAAQTPVPYKVEIQVD